MRCGNRAFEASIKLLFVAPLENALKHLVGLPDALLGVPHGAPRDEILGKEAISVEIAADLLVQLVAPVEVCVGLLGAVLAGPINTIQKNKMLELSKKENQKLGDKKGKKMPVTRMMV
jgi:hypothetical protein